jgi:prepilin-type N-terminal cleavage/methylation domain-containing protein
MLRAEGTSGTSASDRDREGRSGRAGWRILWRRLRLRDDQRGFTLIELANVLMIMGVLMIIGLPAVSDGHKTVKRTACAERQRKIYEGAILYAAENFVPDGSVNVTALYPDYLNSDTGECPSSVTPDYDDYTIVFAGGEPIDVICDIEGDEHPWSPH